MNIKSTLSTVYFCMTLTACGISSEEAERQFEDYIEEHNMCEEDSDCTYINVRPGPKCYIYAFPEVEAADAEAYAAELNASRRPSDRDEFDDLCLEPNESAICVDGVCEIPDNATYE